MASSNPSGEAHTLVITEDQSTEPTVILFMIDGGTAVPASTSWSWLEGIGLQQLEDRVFRAEMARLARYRFERGPDEMLLNEIR